MIISRLVLLKVKNISGKICRENQNGDFMWRERKPTRCNNQVFIINFCLNMFRASLCPSSGEERPCYCIWCVVLVLQPHPAEPAQYTICSNTVFVLLKMGIMMRQKLIINIWLLHLVGFLSLRTLLTMHGHRNLKLPSMYFSPTSCNFLPLKPKYRPGHPVLTQPHPTFFL